MSVMAWITDLIFATKVKSTADEMGVPLTVVRTREAAGHDDNDVHLVIVDLNADGVDPLAVIRRYKTTNATADTQGEGGGREKSAAGSRVVIAFASHVQADLMRTAEQAGADLVLPRSKFNTDLPRLLARYASSQGSQ